MQVTYDPPDKPSSSEESYDDDMISCSQAQPDTKEKVDYHLNTRQKVVKAVFGKVLNQLFNCFKTKFEVPSKHMTTLKPSEHLDCLAKTLIKSGYCSVQAADYKGNKSKVLIHKDIELS